MHSWLQAASAACNQELALPPQSVGPSTGSTATVRKASPPAAGCAPAALAPKHGVAAAARAQAASGGGHTFNLDEVLQVKCLQLQLLLNGVLACHGGNADCVLPLKTTSCLQRRAAEKQKEDEAARVEAPPPGRGARRVTAEERKRKAELQVWLKRKPGASAPPFS